MKCTTGQAPERPTMTEVITPPPVVDLQPIVEADFSLGTYSQLRRHAQIFRSIVIKLNLRAYQVTFSVLEPQQRMTSVGKRFSRITPKSSFVETAVRERSGRKGPSC